MNYADIKCPQCKPVICNTHVMWYDPEKQIAQLQCNLKSDHIFKIDQEGNVIDDGCQSCGG